MVTINVMDFLILSQLASKFYFYKDSIQHLSGYSLVWGTGLVEVYKVLITASATQMIYSPCTSRTLLLELTTTPLAVHYFFSHLSRPSTFTATIKVFVSCCVSVLLFERFSAMVAHHKMRFLGAFTVCGS
jgi:hypothetical protein